MFFTSKNSVNEGETVEIVSPEIKPFEQKIIDLKNEDGENVQSSNHPMSNYSFECANPVKIGSMIRIGK